MQIPGKQIVKRTLGRMAWRGTHCCFALSTGRTGSTTLTTLLNLSPHVHAFHEPAPQLLNETREAFNRVYQEPERFKQIFTAAKSPDIGITRLRGKFYAETSNRLTFLAPVIAELLPQSKFIFLHRHPAEVVRSGMRRGWYVNHRWDPYRIAPAPGDRWYDEWSSWDSFEKTCWYWSAINDFALHFVNTLGPQRCLTMRFDDLKDAEYGAWEFLYRFLDLEPPHLYAVREVLDRRENEQKTGEFAAPSEWTDSQWQTLRSIAGHTAEQLDYTVAPIVQGVAGRRAS